MSGITPRPRNPPNTDSNPIGWRMTAKRPKPTRTPPRSRPRQRPISAPETAPDDTPAYSTQWSAALVRAAPRRVVMALADQYTRSAHDPELSPDDRRFARRR